MTNSTSPIKVFAQPVNAACSAIATTQIAFPLTGPRCADALYYCPAALKAVRLAVNSKAVRNQLEADEVFQETYLKFSRIEAVTDATHAVSLAYLIAGQICKDELRRRRRDAVRVESLSHGGECNDLSRTCLDRKSLDAWQDDVVQDRARERADHIMEQAQHLSDQEKVVFEMGIKGTDTQAKIAEQLDLQQSRISKISATVREKLAHHERERSVWRVA